MDADTKMAAVFILGFIGFFGMMMGTLGYLEIRTKALVLEAIQAGVPPLEASAAIRGR